MQRLAPRAVVDLVAATRAGDESNLSLLKYGYTIFITTFGKPTVPTMRRPISPKEAFLSEFSTYQTSEPAIASFVKSRTHVIEGRKRELILSIDEVNDHLYYIHKGLARSYHMVEDEKGIADRATSVFASESQFLISPHSFLRQKPSQEGMELLEDATIVYVTYQDLQELYATYPAANSIRAMVTERYLLYYVERVQALKFLTGEQKYRWFLANHPELRNNRVPYKHIASYLGLTEEGFNRIRKQMG